jgi:hypothetical protein
MASLLVLTAGAAPARADGAAARVHAERARSLFQVSEYAKAIEEFKAAHVEKPDPLYLYNIAECHRLLGQTKDALVFYRRFIALAPAGSSLVPDAEKRIGELEHPTATAPPPPPATTTTTPSPPPSPPSRPSPPPPAAPPPAAARAPAAAAPLPAAPPPAVTTAPAIVATPAPPAEHRPFYKHGWFYVIVGAVVVAGAVATVGVLSSSKGPDVPTTTFGNRSIFGP